MYNFVLFLHCFKYQLPNANINKNLFKNIRRNLTLLVTFKHLQNKYTKNNCTYETNMKTNTEWMKRADACESCKGAKTVREILRCPLLSKYGIERGWRVQLRRLVEERPGPRPCRDSPSTGRTQAGRFRGFSGSETQHLPNMKSGTRITRSSCGDARFLKAGGPETGDATKGEKIKREKEKRRNAKGWRRTGRRDRKYWIYATPTHNTRFSFDSSRSMSSRLTHQ